MKRKSKFGEKNITKFFQNALQEELEKPLLKLGFIPPYKKSFPGTGKWRTLEFDLWSKQRKKYGMWVVWEIEMMRQWPQENIEKLGEVFSYSRPPRIFTFQIFSPHEKTRKTQCNKEAEKLKKKYPRKLTYKQLDLIMPHARFDRMVKAFEKNKYQAKQHYGGELKSEVKRIVRDVVRALK